MKSRLKIKCVSLAAESKLIRREERKFLKRGRSSALRQKSEHSEYCYTNYRLLHDHRTYDVRREARWANIAYGYCKGHEFADIERNPSGHIDWYKIRILITKYGEGSVEDRRLHYREWEERAREHHVRCLDYHDMKQIERAKRRADRRARRQANAKNESN